MSKSPLDFMSESNGESSLISFVIHLWKEGATSTDQPPTWHGHITPVPNGVRHYFTNISQISELIVAHLNLQK